MDEPQQAEYEMVSVVYHGWKYMYRYWFDYEVYESLGAIRHQVYRRH